MKFGVAVSNWNDKVVTSLIGLNPSLVQIPLHLFRPDRKSLTVLIDHGIEIIGKYVPEYSLMGRAEQVFSDLFQEYNDQIKIWDFGGEPETRPGSEGCRWPGEAKEFAELFESFWTVGTKVSLENRIGSGGFITATYNGLFGNDNRSSFLRELFFYGILNLMHFCSVDLYCFGYGGRKNIVAGLGYIRQLLSEYRQPRLDMTVAEFGVPCSGDPRFLHIIKSETGQANALVRNFLLQRACGASYSIWFSLMFQGWGLLDTQYNPRQSYSAFQYMASTLGGANYLGQFKALPEPDRSLSDQIEWYLFQKGDKEIHVLFLEHSGTVHRMAPGARAFTLFGTELVNSAIILSQSPVYFIANKGVIRPETFLRK